MIELLVTYHAKQGLNSIVGNVDATADRFPDDIDTIRKMEADISKIFKYDNTVITNVLKLKERVNEHGQRGRSYTVTVCDCA